MLELYIAISILILLAAAFFMPDILKVLNISMPKKSISKKRSNTAKPVNVPTIKCTAVSNSGLFCRIQLGVQENSGQRSSLFIVEVKGKIDAPEENQQVTSHLSFFDVTDGNDQPKLIQTTVDKYRKSNSTDFFYQASLGKLPKKNTVLENWTAIAQIQLDWLKFPRKGARRVLCHVTMHSQPVKQTCADSQCIFEYDNPEFGYIDIQENLQRTKSLAVALAFSVSAIDDNMCDCEVEMIKNWARDNIHTSNDNEKSRAKLDDALNKTVDFFKKGNQLDIERICNEVVYIAPMGDRYDIINLCMQVARANGEVSRDELILINQLARWFSLDNDKFRDMIERVLPVSMHMEKDVEAIFGVTRDMSEEQKRNILNKEYRKWNARVTNFDSDVKDQADYMINLIAEARKEFVKK